MKCPFCGHTEDRVVDSRVGRDGEFIRRRRECLKCHRRYTTYEYIEDVLPHVEKRDGRREPFDRQKLRHSILKACEKRSVAVNRVDDIVADIEQQLHERAEKEIKWDELGEMVMEQLQEARPGRLRALLVGVPAVPGRLAVLRHRGPAQGAAQGRQAQAGRRAAPSAAAVPDEVARDQAGRVAR